MAMGEHDGKSFYHASAGDEDIRDRGQVKAIVDGFKALGTLRFSGDADVMKLVNGLKTTVSGSTVQTSWEVSTDDVWTVIEKVGKKIEEHMKNAPRLAMPTARAATRSTNPSAETILSESDHRGETALDVQPDRGVASGAAGQLPSRLHFNATRSTAPITARSNKIPPRTSAVALYAMPSAAKASASRSTEWTR